MSTKTKLLPVVVALVVVLSGCAGFGGGGDAGDGGAGADASSAMDGGDGGGDGGVAPSGDGGGGGGQQADVSTSPLQTDRAIIHTGTLTLRVDEYDAVRSELSQRVRSIGGYVGGSSETQHTSENTTWRSGSLVLRVPADRFSDMLTYARERGAVLNAETSTEDVTDRLVDIEARMTTLEERRSRLRTFYDRANTTEELLRIEERLSNVQVEIEKLRAEKRSLEQRISYATLRVELRERHDNGSETTGTDERTVASVFFGSVTTIVDIGQWSLLLLAGALPYLVVFGVPAALIYGLSRRVEDVPFERE